MAKQKYYAYLVAEKKRRGVTDSWAVCEKMVKGEPNARYRAFKSEEEAREWLRMGAPYGEKKKMSRGVYFDSGTGRGLGVEIKVTDEKGRDLLDEARLAKKSKTKFETYSVPDATNNYGELFACQLAIKIALKKNMKLVAGDSALVVNFWSKGFVKKDGAGEETEKLADRTAKLRREFEGKGGRMELISGDDNPADLGFHR